MSLIKFIRRDNHWLIKRHKRFHLNKERLQTDLFYHAVTLLKADYIFRSGDRIFYMLQPFYFGGYDFGLAWINLNYHSIDFRVFLLDFTFLHPQQNSFDKFIYTISDIWLLSKNPCLK